ncbi:MAG TPA: amidohydrolase family protein [Longimicrobiales bacterium]|nr:amidohydrolase family protein [Longimicrobiales bacterium]
MRAHMMNKALALALVVAAAALPGGAEAQVPAPAQAGPIALTGGTIHPVSGPAIEGGTIVFENGVITGVGRSVDIPAGAERIDIAGLHVYPGLIDGYSAMGLYEIGAVDMTVDLVELGRINPNVRAEVAVNPESRHIGTARSNGVLVTATTPAGGLISGLSAALMLDGWTYEQMTIRAPLALNVNWPNPSNEGRYEEQVRELRETFASARAYQRAQAAARGGQAPRHATDSRWEAMIPALEGTIPVVVSADELRQLQDAMEWAEQEGVRLVLRGGADAAYVAEHLARKQIPVLLTSVMSPPSRSWEPYDGAYTLPARLHAAGVPFAITAGSSAPYANRLPYEAGSAVAFGLPVDEAVKALTLYPARILGIDDRVGSLEPGKDATLIITTGNPLDYPTTVERAFIQGRDIDLMDIHRQFFRKYMEKVNQAREGRIDVDGVSGR